MVIQSQKQSAVYSTVRISLFSLLCACGWVRQRQRETERQREWVFEEMVLRLRRSWKKITTGCQRSPWFLLSSWLFSLCQRILSYFLWKQDPWEVGHWPLGLLLTPLTRLCCLRYPQASRFSHIIFRLPDPEFPLLLSMLTILCDSNRLDKIAAPRSIKDDCLQNKCLLGGLQGLQRHNIIP